ncbi:hypothetical protein DYQ86_25295 [Acidobacteria bacterium AB60]|nr:hypothetical protein DYQ86_25295 [Acidobacteria bacterium AB60]
MILVATGLVLIAAGLFWPGMIALHGTMSPGGVDFVQGFVVGIGFACEVLGISGAWARRGRRSEGDVLTPPQ